MNMQISGCHPFFLLDPHLLLLLREPFVDSNKGGRRYFVVAHAQCSPQLDFCDIIINLPNVISVISQKTSSNEFLDIIMHLCVSVWVYLPLRNMPKRLNCSQVEVIE